MTIETDAPTYDNPTQNVVIPLLHNGERLHGGYGDPCYDVVNAQTYKQARAIAVMYNNRFNVAVGEVVFRLAYEV